jgi:hypothetical protein
MAFHLFSQIQGAHEAYVNSVNFCLFLHNMRKICHILIAKSPPL